MSHKFSEFTLERQVESLADCVVQILSQYELEGCQTESINHEFNSTFKVIDGKGAKFALRINVNSTRTLSNLRAEIFWVKSITDLAVAKPVSNAEGEFITAGWHEATERNLNAILYTWLEGEEPGDEPTLQQLEAAGKAMATLHNSSVHLELPHDAELPALDDFYWGAPDLLGAANGTLNEDESDLVEALKLEVQTALAELAKTTARQPIHADLHPWNLMWNDGGIAVFDFDDSGLGLPIQDLATSLYYLDTPEQDQAFLAGYASVRTLPEHSPELLQLLFLQRRLILLNYLHETSNPEHIAMVPEYKAETIRRIKSRVGRPID